MRDNFEYFWKFLIFWEKEYAGDIKDGAGLTIFGFTEKYYPDLVKKLKELYFKDKKQAEELAKKNAKTLYWDALSCDYLPSKLDIVIADCSFNQGISVAKKVLELTAQDYLAYLKNQGYSENHSWIIAILKRSDFYDNLRAYDRFGRGWNKRIISLYEYLLTDYKELKWD